MNPPLARTTRRSCFASRGKHFILIQQPGCNHSDAEIPALLPERRPCQAKKRGGIGMRVLVTGHTGFIGAVMVPMLQRAGHDVVGMDTGFYDECAFLGSVAKIAAIKKDIRDATRSDVEGLDAVIHLAALSNDPLGDFDPELTYDINHRATVKLATLA